MQSNLGSFAGVVVVPAISGISHVIQFGLAGVFILVIEFSNSKANIIISIQNNILEAVLCGVQSGAGHFHVTLNEFVNNKCIINNLERNIVLGIFLDGEGTKGQIDRIVQRLISNLNGNEILIEILCVKAAIQTRNGEILTIIGLIAFDGIITQQGKELSGNLQIIGVGEINNLIRIEGDFGKVIITAYDKCFGAINSNDFNSHSHGANHDDSQYQCEYFFHCDFLL